LSLRSLRIPAAIFLLLIATVALVPSLRTPILQSAGRVLVASDPIERADVVVLAVDADASGVLEAADLVHDGIAKAVGIFAEVVEPADLEFIRRGLHDEDRPAHAARQLRLLGVTMVEQIPTRVTGTEDQPPILFEWCNEHQYRSVVIVTTADHSRRVRRVFHRALRGQDLRVFVRPARLSSFDPDRWWQTRDGIRTGIVEFQKLLLDIVRHPIPVATRLLEPAAR
jgi:hypothetical protein